MSMARLPNGQTWGEDRTPAKSHTRKYWISNECLEWELEVRTEELGGGTIRLGELLVKGQFTGELTLSIKDDNHALRF